MSEAKHTPGPWAVGSISPTNGGIEVRYDGPDHLWHIADVYGQKDSSKPLTTRHGYRESNARLIAAAPDLLEMCRRSAGAFRATARAMRLLKHDVAAEAMSIAEDATRAVIAKAEPDNSNAGAAT